MGPTLTAHRLLFRILFVTGVITAAAAGVSLAWSAIGGGPLGVHGLIALSLGIGGATALAWALMALAFKSSREGWDERSADPADSEKP